MNSGLRKEDISITEVYAKSRKGNLKNYFIEILFFNLKSQPCLFLNKTCVCASIRNPGNMDNL